MRSTTKLFFASLFTVSALFAQRPPMGGPGPDGMRGGMGPGGMGHGGPPVTGAPYSATSTDTRQETLTDGNQIQETHTAKVYRDAEGRTRTEVTMTNPSGVSKTMIMISDPVARFVAHLNPADSTAMKMTMSKPPSGMPKDRPERTADANAPQRVKTDLGPKTIAGLATTGTRTTTTIAAGAMGNSEAIVETREVWMSTALKIPVETTSTDPRRGKSTMVLSNVSQTAPDAALFQIPSSYTVKDGPGHRAHGGPDGPGPDATGPGAPPAFDGGSL